MKTIPMLCHRQLDYATHMLAMNRQNNFIKPLLIIFIRHGYLEEGY